MVILFEYLLNESDTELMYNIYIKLFKMAKSIKDMVVWNITLVTSNETPAVEKATTKFSIFKTVAKMCWKETITKTQKEELKKIATNLEKTLKKCWE